MNNIEALKCIYSNHFLKSGKCAAADIDDFSKRFRFSREETLALSLIAMEPTKEFYAIKTSKKLTDAGEILDRLIEDSAVVEDDGHLRLHGYLAFCLRYSDVPRSPEELFSAIFKYEDKESDPEFLDWLALYAYDYCDHIIDLRCAPIGSQMVFWKLAGDFYEHFTRGCFLDEKETEDARILMNQGIVTCREDDMEGMKRRVYLLSPSAAKLFRGVTAVDYSRMMKYASIVKPDAIESRELYYSSQTHEEYENLAAMLTADGFNRVCAIFKKKQKPPCIMSMFWGPSGTGKTECARQLARRSDRDLIVYDTAKVMNTLVGESEKNMRDFFNEYRYIWAVRQAGVPIILLNEADQVLSARLANINHSIDKLENTLSNILLEELENFSGILLATTNMKDNIDEAFHRRFLFMSEMARPDKDARAKIWSANIPELSESEACTLAERYEFTGAQIQNITLQRELAELYYTGSRGFSYIEQLCKKISPEKRMERARVGYL